MTTVIRCFGPGFLRGMQLNVGYVERGATTQEYCVLLETVLRLSIFRTDADYVNLVYCNDEVNMA